MHPKEPTRELRDIIERFESAQREGITPYLDSDQYLEIAEWYMNNKMEEEVNNLLDAAIEIHPNDRSILQLYTTILIHNNELVKARNIIENLALEENSLEIKQLSIDLLAHEGKESEALDILDELSVQDLSIPRCLEVSCLCFNVQFYKESIQWAERVLKLDEDNEEALSLICESYGGLKEDKKVIKVANRLLDINPYSAIYWSELARAYSNLDQLDKALEACDFAIVADESCEEPYAIKGRIYYQLENYEAAIEGYSKAWELSRENDESAMLFLSYCYIALENWEQAYECTVKARATTSPDSILYNYLFINTAASLRMIGQREEAHKELDRCISISPTFMEAYIKNGQYYLEEDNINKAMHYFEKAIAVNETPTLWARIGNVAFECKEYELAQKAYKATLDLDSDYEGIEMKLHLVSELLEKEDQSLPTLKYYIDMLNKISNPETANPYSNIDQIMNQALDEEIEPEEMQRLKDSMVRVNDMLDFLKAAREEEDESEEEEE